MEALAKENNNLYLKIPGGLQPRCAIGYSFFTLLITMTKLGFISDKSIDIQNAILNIEKDSHIYSDMLSILFVKMSNSKKKNVVWNMVFADKFSIYAVKTCVVNFFI